MLEKHYEPGDVENRIYARWEDSGAFAAGRSVTGDAGAADPFCIMIPPPNVTGSLHMGHALTFTLQDILIRYRRMQGFDTLWQPGTDHAGIATQMVVERQLAEQGTDRRTLGREKFVDTVWQWKAQSGGTITHQLRRLGASLDWPRERFTLDDGLSYAVRKVFVDLHKEGLIYRNKRLVNWDPKLHTAISDLEVENREIKGSLWYFRYPLADDPTRHVTVATTRPETMLGDTGVAVHPDDDRYRDIVGQDVLLPIVNRRIPVVADAYADPEKGSGAVKITPAHDFNDFEVGRRNALGVINVFDSEAAVLDRFPLFRFDGPSEARQVTPVTGDDGAQASEDAPDWLRGLDRQDARRKIVGWFEENGLLDSVEDNAMTVPYGDRSGVVIEPWLTDQWFVDAAALAAPAIGAVEDGRTVFVPRNWENTYFEWMRNIQPWCISRQLWWGHRIPAWFGPDGTPFVAMTEEEAQAMANARYGEAVTLRQDEDVLDTWFSSALWPFSTLGWPDRTPELGRYYPTQVLVTGFDIIFFWVARMMMMGLKFMDNVPFKTVYIHALVRDEKGQKMSKSKGNIIDPLVVADQYGTDALRFTLAALAAQGRDIKMSESRVQGYRNFVTKLWNAARFCEMNDCRPVDRFRPEDVALTLNRWILDSLADCRDAVGAGIESYRFNDAANAIYRFAWGTFCDWFLEFAKPLLTGDDRAAQSETRATAAFVLDEILKLLHPFMPFVTEELWATLGEGRTTMLITTPWPARQAPGDAEAQAEIDWVIELITQIRSVRQEMNVPPGAQLPVSVADASEATRARLSAHAPLIARLARVSDLRALDGPASDGVKGALQFVLGEATVFVAVAGHIDMDQERARLAKEIEKVDGEINRFEKKLANDAFVSRAPAEVIEEQREKLAAAQSARARLQSALDRLRAAA